MLSFLVIFSVLWFNHPFCLFLYFNLSRNFNKAYMQFILRTAWKRRCLVPRPHYSVRPKRFGSRGPSKNASFPPVRLGASPRWIDREGLQYIQGIGKKRWVRYREQFNCFKILFFQLKRWRSGLSNVLSPCPGCLKWLRYGWIHNDNRPFSP